MDLGALPLEIWADFLEEAGEDTEALRLWIQFAFFTTNHFECTTGGDSYGMGDGSGDGYGSMCRIVGGDEFVGGDGYGFGEEAGDGYLDTEDGSYGDGKCDGEGRGNGTSR